MCARSAGPSGRRRCWRRGIRTLSPALMPPFSTSALCMVYFFGAPVGKGRGRGPKSNPLGDRQRPQIIGDGIFRITAGAAAHGRGSPTFQLGDVAAPGPRFPPANSRPGTVAAARPSPPWAAPEATARSARLSAAVAPGRGSLAVSVRGVQTSPISSPSSPTLAACIVAPIMALIPFDIPSGNPERAPLPAPMAPMHRRTLAAHRPRPLEAHAGLRCCERVDRFPRSIRKS